MSEQMKSAIRQILLVLAGVGPIAALLTKLGIDPSQWPQVVDIVLLIGGAVASLWAIWTRSKKNLVATAAAIVPVPAVSQHKVGIEIPVAPDPAKAPAPPT